MSSTPLDLLVTFTVFAESPNISEAARRLGLSQPAVSVQLKRLQERMPQPLFVFQGKRKALSHYGRAVYETLRDRLQSIERGLERVNLVHAKPENLHLRVGARREVFVLIGGRIRFPGSLELRTLSHPEILDQLTHGKIDAGITYIRPDDPNVLSKELLVQTAELCVSKKWLKKKPFNLEVARNPEFLKNTPYLAYKVDRPPYLMEWVSHCGLELKDLKLRAVCDDWTVILQMVQAGMGFSIMPSGILTGAPGVEVVEIPEKIIPKRTFYLLYSKSLRNVPGIRDLFQ